MEKEKLAFESPDTSGFIIRAWYLKEPNDGDAQIEITRDSKPYKEFLYPAYKIWNLAAHWNDIVKSELEKSDTGYLIAGHDGLGGMTLPREVPPAV